LPEVAWPDPEAFVRVDKDAVAWASVPGFTAWAEAHVRPTDAEPPRPLAPLGGALVDPAAVPLRWEGVPGATGYAVQLSPDRSFRRHVLTLSLGAATEVVLTGLLPATPARLFWRLRATTPDGVTRWSPYGRFHTAPDAAVDGYRAAVEAAQAEARREALRRQAEDEAARDLVPFIDREDTIPSAAEVRALGLTMILSVVVTVLAVLAATLLGS